MTQENQQNKPDLDWQEMSSLWQQDGFANDLNMDQLATSIKRKALQMKMMLALEWLISLVGVIVGLLVYLKYDSLFETAVGIVTIAASLFMGWFGYKNRRNTWQAKDETFSAMVDLSIKRAKAAISYAKMNLYTAPMAIIFVKLAYDHRSKDFDTMAPEKASNLQMLFGLAMVFIVAAVIWSIWYWVRNKRNLNYWLEIKGQLTEK